MINNKITLTLLLLIVGINISLAQSQHKIDALADMICKELNKQIANGKSVDVNEFYTTIIDEQKIEMELARKTFIRLQTTCDSFSKLAHDRYERDEDWKIHQTRPKSSISKKEAKKFFKQQSLYYKEGDGKLTKVNFDKKFWYETFPDESFSKLHLKMIDKRNFKLVFIESNNYLKKNMSKKGDEYFYELLEVNDEYYKLSVTVPNRKHYFTFKMYHKPVKPRVSKNI